MERYVVAKEKQAQISETADAIERYLYTRPQAAETVEGIARWWLHRQRYEDSVEVVQQALDVLVTRGVVERLAIAGGQPMYRTTPINRPCDA
jgi:Fe2+ or Zn2+ uptake regulation protein